MRVCAWCRRWGGLIFRWPGRFAVAVWGRFALETWSTENLHFFRGLRSVRVPGERVSSFSPAQSARESRLLHCSSLPSETRGGTLEKAACFFGVEMISELIQ